MPIGFLVYFEYPMDYGYITIFDFEYYHVAHVYLFGGVVQEEDVTALEGGFHGTGEDDYYW